MKIKHLLLIFIVIMTVSCSSLQKTNKIQEDESILDVNNNVNNEIMGIYDPWEPFNRRMYYFNAKLDHYVLLPVSKGYKAVVPDPVEKGVHNFFKNLGDVKNFTNSALQGSTKKSLISFNRFVINSTFGIFGIFDVATKVGLERQREDFGLTLAHYGVQPGPYLVLPIFGPSNVRDATGLGVDTVIRNYTDPLQVADAKQSDLEITTLEAIDLRSNINFRYYQTGSPFEYEYVRYFYYKLRELEGGLDYKQKDHMN